MKDYKPIFSNAARLRQEGNDYIVSSLARAGLHGVVPSHGDILVNLLKNGSCRMSELAHAVGRSKSTVTTLIEKLEREGLVSRETDSADSRSVLVRLTEKGKGLEAVFEEISAGLQALLSERLTQEEQQMLDALLRKATGQK